ncbi:MAG: aminodeoxychorismate synthase component I [Candidatus Margulisbacteria bacterium]|nr:aminodeoxychorismate synthase component I [Candidatus Margulisiibacteriota bacterium]
MLVQIEFEKQPLLFEQPIDLIVARQGYELPACFAQMESSLAGGCYLAGFLSYEAGYGFEEKLAAENKSSFPLLQMGVYKKPKNRNLSRSDRDGFQKQAKNKVMNKKTNITQEKYFANIRKIREYLEAGDTYEITYCLKFLFDFAGNPYDFYRQLYTTQPVPYPAYIEGDDYFMLSLSPELFMKKKGTFLTTKPMKGTWPRGRNLWEDLWAGRKLHFDSKNRAENLMITDLLRNDLGRIGSNVKVPKLFEVARYNTLYQMTSTVTANIQKDLPLYDLLKALHPSGSVTGAPKIRSMEIIRELEPEPRHIYTGAIGYITPERDLMFNVPIRTILLEGTHGEMGVGGGIVWDSTPVGEWEECLWKAGFLG